MINIIYACQDKRRIIHTIRNVRLCHEMRDGLKLFPSKQKNNECAIGAPQPALSPEPLPGSDKPRTPIKNLTFDRLVIRLERNKK